MNVGKAITEAMRAERDADRRGFLWSLLYLRPALQANYWWGWESAGNQTIKERGFSAIHEFRCERSFGRTEAPCTCRLVGAWR